MPPVTATAEEEEDAAAAAGFFFFRAPRFWSRRGLGGLGTVILTRLAAAAAAGLLSCCCPGGDECSGGRAAPFPPAASGRSSSTRNASVCSSKSSRLACTQPVTDGRHTEQRRRSGGRERPGKLRGHGAREGGVLSPVFRTESVVSSRTVQLEASRISGSVPVDSVSARSSLTTSSSLDIRMCMRTLADAHSSAMLTQLRVSGLSRGRTQNSPTGQQQPGRARVRGCNGQLV
jgi:hypothetical protein